MNNNRWNPEVTVQISKVPWEEEEEGWQLRVSKFTEQVMTVMRRRRSNWEQSYFETFSKRQLALFVFDCNRLEGTLSESMWGGKTIENITNYLNDSEVPVITSWNAEGGRESDTASSDMQLYQTSRAAKFLFEEKRDVPLSKSLIIDTHSLLMCNAEEYDNKGKVIGPVPVGAFRTTEVNAGLYQFVPASSVEGGVNMLIARYEEKRNGNYHPIALATYLFYELITIHPFTNGNGRLCRCFLMWSLMRDGFPFPASFSSGHKKCRQHYMHAINTARRSTNNRGELNVIATVSIERALANYLENICTMSSSVAEEGVNEV